MAVAKSSWLRLAVIFLCMALGTGLGIFLRRYSAALSALFFDFADFTIDLRTIDFIMIKFGFLFGLKLNLGTLIGAAVGIVVTR